MGLSADEAATRAYSLRIIIYHDDGDRVIVER